MKNALQAILLGLCLSTCATTAGAQSILDQSKDDLLKDFDAGKSLSAPPLAGPQGANAAGQRSWAPQGSNPGSNTQGNYAPGSYQFPAQPKGLIQRLIEGAMNAVSVYSNDSGGTQIKAPFVNVNTSGPNPGVKVKAPFVNYDSINGASVKAPFVNVGNDGAIKVKAPFVNINHGYNQNQNNGQTNPSDSQSGFPNCGAPNNQYPNSDQGSSLR